MPPSVEWQAIVEPLRFGHRVKCFVGPAGNPKRRLWRFAPWLRGACAVDGPRTWFGRSSALVVTNVHTSTTQIRSFMGDSRSLQSRAVGRTSRRRTERFYPSTCSDLHKPAFEGFSYSREDSENRADAQDRDDRRNRQKLSGVVGSHPAPPQGECERGERS